jgi:CHAT domain
VGRRLLLHRRLPRCATGCARRSAPRSDPDAQAADNWSAEPGLLLTPPQMGTEVDDGYLSASEIAGLKLDADWVILSACNTAAGEAKGAEALSGLARAFFYAGARALLVSHLVCR